MKSLNQLWMLSSLALLSTAAQAEEGAIPQMDQTWYPNQLFWLAISFGILFLIVSRLIVPTISSVLKTRENAIEQAIAEAERAKAAAESTRGSSASTSQDTRVKAAEIMAQTQAEISKEAASQLGRIDRELARKAENAIAVLEDALKKAESSVAEATESLAAAMVGKLLGDSNTVEAPAEPKLKLAKR